MIFRYFGDLSSTLHINSVVAEAHSVQQLFSVSSRIEMLTYLFVLILHNDVRPLVERNSVIWSPYTVKDIGNIETVHRRFTKPLPSFCALSYTERLKRLNLPSVNLRRLHTDLIYCYNIVFRLTDLLLSDFFRDGPSPDHYRLHKKRCSALVRYKFFSERVVSIRNNLPCSVDFSSLTRFICTVKIADLPDYLRCL